MKLVVTILQARRVVLPYFFIRHVWPRMREMFPGEIEVVIVQHRRLPKSSSPFLDTSSSDESGSQRVLEWTEADRFSPAAIIPHDVEVPNYPSIPSMHIACAEALKRQADLHLWLEDDALVDDPDCHRWPRLLETKEVGVFRYFSDINSAFFLSRPPFDERILPALARYSEWSRQRRIEPFLRKMLKTRRAYLNPAAAVRTHRNVYPYTGDKFVAARLRALSPSDAPLLDLERGEGASTLPVVTRAEMGQLHVQDWARPLELLRRIRNAIQEQTRPA